MQQQNCKAHSSFLEHNFEGGKKKIVCYNNKLTSKVRKTQHHNPEFVHKQGEIKKRPAKKYFSIKGGKGVKLRKLSIFVVKWVSSCLSFFLSASTAATYIFTAPRTLEPCALNAEFQHFIPRFNKTSLLYILPLKGLGVKRGPKKKRKEKKGDFMDNSNVLSKYNREIWGGSLQNTKSMTTTTSSTENMNKRQKKSATLIWFRFQVSTGG